jgi:amino acid transporter
MLSAPNMRFSVFWDIGGIIAFAGSFLNTILYTAPVVWLFFTGTCASVWILRRKDPLAERPFKVPLYPIPTVLFAAACVFMLYSSAAYAVSQRPLGFAIVTAILAAGAIIYGLTKRRNH